MEKMFLRAFLCVLFAISPYAQYITASEDLSIEEQISPHMEGNSSHTAAKPPAIKIAGVSLRDGRPLNLSGPEQPREEVMVHLTERCFLDRKCATPIKYQSNYLAAFNPSFKEIT
ncbi:hypothetical protein ABES25_04125 [Bacillus gobiensis]|uniref:hypothetical protein n=1 Tax=Bacillus gobiensis TaxID=1441095 RepID=UPI003D1D0FFF